MTIATRLSIVFWLAAYSALAQMSDITGYVKNAAGKPVAGAVMQILRQDVTRNYQTKTDKRGSYYYQGLPVGFYTVKVIVDGNEAIGVTGLRTQPGSPLEVNFDLGVSPQEQEARIKSSLRKMGAEWSSVTILTVQPASPAVAPAASPPAPAAASAPPTGSESAQLFRSGMGALEAKDYATAIADLRRASQVDAAQPAIWVNLATAYMARAAEGDLADALMAYEKALALMPGDAAIHYNYALALAKSGKRVQMRAEIKRCAELEPASAYRTYYNFGTLLSNAGDADAAGEAFRQAIAAAPDEPKNAESYYQAAVSLMGRAQVGSDGKLLPAPGTVEWLQKYLRLAPTGPNAQAARDLLATMGAVFTK